MERKKLILFLVFILHSFVSFASYKEEIYYAYISNKMELWQEVIDKINKIPDKSNETILEQLNYCYGFVGWCLGNKKKDIAKKYLQLGNELITKLEQKKYKLSVIYAYKSAFIGYEIGISPYKAPFIGSKSIEYAYQSIKFDSSNYFAYIQLGNAEYYKPAIFGGSKKEAIKYFLKALKFYNSKRNEINKDWNLLHLLATIGKIYLEINDYNNAKLYFDKALKIEPNFHWVKNELYPLLSTKIR